LKKVIYYITDHGRGHATRSAAIIRELKKLGIEVIVRNSNSVDFLRKSLPEILIEPALTDVGPTIKENGISIDRVKSIPRINDWIDNLEKVSNKEVIFIKKIHPDLIISDISAMPLKSSQKTQTRSIAISNFSWYDVLDFIPKDKLEKLREAYDCAELCIKLPLGTKMAHFKKIKKVGLVARTTKRNRLQIRSELGINDSEFCVLLALGGSKIRISCKKEKNIKILSMGTNVKKSLNAIDLSNWIEGQELVSASDFVICKCGYGLISECLSNGVQFFYVADDNHPEQIAISRELINQGHNRRTSFEKINQLTLSENFLNQFSPFNKERIDTDSTVNYILEFLKN